MISRTVETLKAEMNFAFETKGAELENSKKSKGFKR